LEAKEITRKEESEKLVIKISSLADSVHGKMIEADKRESSINSKMLEFESLKTNISS